MKINVRPANAHQFQLVDGNLRISVMDQMYRDVDYTLETNCGPIKRSQLVFPSIMPLPLTPAEDSYRRRMREFEINSIRDFKHSVGTIWEQWNGQRLTSTQAMLEVEKLIIQFDITLSEREAEINAEAR